MLLGCCLYLTAREGTGGATRKASTPKQPLCISPPVLGLVYHLNQHNWDVFFCLWSARTSRVVLAAASGRKVLAIVVLSGFATCPELPMDFLAHPSLLCSTWVMIWGYQCALGATAQSHTEPMVPVAPAAGIGRMERRGV